MAHLALIRLRITEPDHERPYRSPGRLRVPRPRRCRRSRSSACSARGCRSSSSPRSTSTVAVAGFLWLAIGVVVYVVYRRRQGLDLVTTVAIVQPQPVVEREAEYESVLVAFDVGHYAPDAVATAAKLAARRRRGHPRARAITVPQLRADRRRAARAGAAPRRRSSSRRSCIGGRRVSGHFEKVRAGQAGRLIVEEAREMRAGRDRHAAAARARGGSAVRPDAGDRARRAPVPRDHRVDAGRRRGAVDAPAVTPRGRGAG